MYLLDIMDCEYISAIYSGNKEEDNKANAEIKVKINCIEDIAAESPIFTES